MPPDGEEPANNTNRLGFTCCQGLVPVESHFVAVNFIAYLFSCQRVSSLLTCKSDPNTSIQSIPVQQSPAQYQFKSSNNSIIILLFASMESRSQHCFPHAPKVQHSQNQKTSFHQSSLSSSQVLTSNQLQEQELSSLLGFTIQESEFNSRFYQITSDLLRGSPVNQLMRAKLRLWLCEESARLGLSRKVYCLSNTLIDLFLVHGGSVSVAEFHLLGLSCLRMANKLADNGFLPINDEVFPAKSLTQWEEKVCFKLGFRLNPVSNVDFLDGLLCAWNRFSKMHSLWSYQGFGNIVHNFEVLDASKLYEIIDFIYLFPKSFDFPKGILEYQVLNILLEEHYRNLQPTPLSIEDEVLIRFWMNPEESSLKEEPFSKIFLEFSTFLKMIFPWVGRFDQTEKKKADLWVKELLSQGAQFSVRPYVEIWRQTFNESWFPTYKRMVQPIGSKSQRKSSSDTTI